MRVREQGNENEGLRIVCVVCGAWCVFEGWGLRIVSLRQPLAASAALKRWVVSEYAAETIADPFADGSVGSLRPGSCLSLK